MPFGALFFNPYWGYDGGGHLDYIFALANGHFPSISTNYLAWHEPLYYLLLAPIWRLSHSILALQITQTMLALALAVLSWKLICLLTKNPYARVAAFLTWNLLAPVRLASTFITNELLNYFWILLIAYIALEEKVDDDSAKISPRTVVTLGVLGGLALLTKITGIVAILAVVIALVATRWKTKEGSANRKTALKQAAAILAIAVTLYTPWLIFRTQNILPSLSINNTEYLPPASLKPTKERLKFFLTFDRDVFKFPYWYSGGRGFWSMLYADTFWDYYGMLENRDELAKLPAAEKIATNHNGGFVSLKSFQRAKYFPYLALPFALIMLIGAYELLKKPFSIPTLLSAGLFAALLYFSYRYPFYDRGIVKAIFVGPMYLPLLAAGFTKLISLTKREK